MGFLTIFYKYIIQMGITSNPSNLDAGILAEHCSRNLVKNKY